MSSPLPIDKRRNAKWHDLTRVLQGAQYPQIRSLVIGKLYIGSYRYSIGIGRYRRYVTDIFLDDVQAALHGRKYGLLIGHQPFLARQ